MIERAMYLGQHDWARVRHPPTDVKTYVKEILLNIAQVQAEVVAIWPGLEKPLIERVVLGAGEEMARLISCVKSFSRHGALQAHIDIAALTFALQTHQSSAAT